jgi:hypothetical protein
LLQKKVLNDTLMLSSIQGYNADAPEPPGSDSWWFDVTAKVPTIYGFEFCFVERQTQKALIWEIGHDMTYNGLRKFLAKCVHADNWKDVTVSSNGVRLLGDDDTILRLLPPSDDIAVS